MLRNIILALFAFIVLGFIFVWIISGGPRKVFNSVQSLSLSGTSSGEFSLPWQPSNLFPAINEDDLFDESDYSYGADTELSDIEREYQELARQTGELTTFGDPSPLFGDVKIVPYDSYPQGGKDEYIRVQARYENTAPISLSGWSLQSAISGTRVFFPPAAPQFVMGAVNNQRPISLNPGATLIVVTAPSPVGISFRENACTGYLSQLQSFSPELSRDCPNPQNELPLSTENLQLYGESCIDYVRTLPSCEFPQNLPSYLSASCHAFVQTRFSYNGCLNTHANDIGFTKDTWRVFLSANELWHNNHDAIRLLDAQGRVVDAYVY